MWFIRDFISELCQTIKEKAYQIYLGLVNLL